MARMIRKQVYIEARQQAALKRLARGRGLSEAAVIRRAIEAVSTGGAHPVLPDPAAWEEAMGFMRALARRPARRARRPWKREELYEERLKRYDRRPD